MSGCISLRFAEVLRELEYLRALSIIFLERGQAAKIDQFRRELEGFQQSASTFYRWEIPTSSPIRTKTSGDYELDSSGIRVYGTISAIWEIEKVGNANGVFRTAGLASTTIMIYRAIDHCLLTHFNIDVGDAISPGCHFHAQSGNSALPIPRFSSLAITPAAAIEFALAELFQNGWPERAGGGHQGASGWRRLQRNRILCYLQWMHDLVLQSLGSPWIEYKRAKPPSDLFLVGSVRPAAMRPRAQP